MIAPIDLNSNGINFLFNNKNISFFKYPSRESKNENLWDSGQRLFHVLQNIPANSVIATPESFINYPINRMPEFISFLQHALSPHKVLMLASQYQDQNNALFQAVYVITQDGVTFIYLKQHAIPCIERMPRYLQGWKRMCKLFKADQSFMPADPQGEMGFYFKGVYIIPRICSDFFLKTSWWDLRSLTKKNKGNVIVIVHVNDDWFNQPMKNLLSYFAHMQSRLGAIDVLYVDYQ
ncbi:hypothetical protein FJ364_04700 [Candidatus Dependentiae bacterium]|nr:hypothetical protein [Candidatus Dependentiae bacterium]